MSALADNSSSSLAVINSVSKLIRNLTYSLVVAKPRRRARLFNIWAILGGIDKLTIVLTAIVNYNCMTKARYYLWISKNSS